MGHNGKMLPDLNYGQSHQSQILRGVKYNSKFNIKNNVKIDSDGNFVSSSDIDDSKIISDLDSGDQGN